MSIIIIVFFSLVILIKAILVRLVIKFKVPRSGQHVYVPSYCPCIASPSVHKPSLTLRSSTAKWGYVRSKCLDASESDRWHMDPSSVRLLACHVICSAVASKAYHLCRLGNRQVPKNIIQCLFVIRILLPDWLVPSISAKLPIIQINVVLLIQHAAIFTHINLLNR